MCRADNASMTATAIEPGLVRIFTWYAGLRLAVGLLVLLSVRDGPDPANPRFPQAGVFFFSMLFVVLVVPWVRDRLGRWLLPVALMFATVGPIADSASNIVGRLDAGLSPNEALADYWLPFFLLWVPLLIVAWQYRYRAVVAWAVFTTLLDLAVTAPPLEQADADLAILGALIVGRGLLFAFVGLFVVKLVREQRSARHALSEHAVALEELATSRERTRLARELHDTLAHSLSAVAVQLEATKSLWDDDPDAAKDMLDRSLDGARSGLGEARRAIQALRASPLEERGLENALQLLGSSVAARSGLDIEISTSGGLDGLAPELEQAVYRIADEALTNAVRHADADSVSLQLDRRGRRVSLEVRDDGRGFDPHRAAPGGHVGIQGMRERAEVSGGTCQVLSSPGSGTTVRFDVETP